jgi:hypothetical protein
MSTYTFVGSMCGLGMCAKIVKLNRKFSNPTPNFDVQVQWWDAIFELKKNHQLKA